MIAKDSVEKFVAYWLAQEGSERSRCHQFWDSLLGEVLGVADLKRFIEYEKPVYFNDGTTKSLDAWIPSTKVLIEHKSSGIDLDARQKYAGASFAELYGEKMYLFADLVAAHEANDEAVLAAYGWPTDLTEPEIVSRLFDLYEKLTKEGTK